MFFQAGKLWLLMTVAAALGCAQDGFGEIQSHVTEFTLHNGMKFIVLERHQAPVASFLTYVDVGSVQEVKGITGLAHIFEHMAFKGTPTMGGKNYAEERPALDRVDQAFQALQAERQKGAKADPGKLKQLEADFKAAQDGAGKFVVKNEFGEAIERAGGRELNAATSTDWTRYYFSLPSNSAELWFFLESERFLHPVFREFYKERDVVMEERRMRNESQPIGKLIEEFLAIAYKAHPYGEPTVGHMSDLEQITRADAQSFLKKYYVPSNMAGVIVGDVNPREMRALAETYFGRLPSGPKPEPLRTVEPPQNGERRVTLRLRAQPLVLVGYHKPSVRHPDYAIYEALSSLLSQGRSSRLYRHLVKEKKIAVQSAGFSGFPGEKYPGMFLFYAFIAPGHNPPEVEKAFEEEVSRLKTELVSAEELDGVKRRAQAGVMRQLRDNMQIANQLADYQMLTGDWRNFFKEIQDIARVTPGDIQRVARQTFTESNKTVGVIETLQTAQTR